MKPARAVTIVAVRRADGSGRNIGEAVNDAKRNIVVPPNHYKRHCDTKRAW